jgi:hypothetical protein
LPAISPSQTSSMPRAATGQSQYAIRLSAARVAKTEVRDRTNSMRTRSAWQAMSTPDCQFSSR